MALNNIYLLYMQNKRVSDIKILRNLTTFWAVDDVYVKTGGTQLVETIQRGVCQLVIIAGWSSGPIQAVLELGQGIRDPYEVAIDKPHSLPNIRFAKV